MQLTRDVKTFEKKRPGLYANANFYIGELSERRRRKAKNL